MYYRKGESLRRISRPFIEETTVACHQLIPNQSPKSDGRSFSILRVWQNADQLGRTKKQQEVTQHFRVHHQPHVHISAGCSYHQPPQSLAMVSFPSSQGMADLLGNTTNKVSLLDNGIGLAPQLDLETHHGLLISQDASCPLYSEYSGSLPRGLVIAGENWHF